MKIIQNSARQGELYIDRIQTLPLGLKKVSPTQTENQYIVAHSETGHHHVIDANPSVNLYLSDDPMISYLEVLEATDEVEALLRHLKVGPDCHETLKFTPGIYELINQSEADSTPEGWRKAID